MVELERCLDNCALPAPVLDSRAWQIVRVRKPIVFTIHLILLTGVSSKACIFSLCDG